MKDVVNAPGAFVIQDGDHHDSLLLQTGAYGEPVVATEEVKEHGYYNNFEQRKLEEDEVAEPGDYIRQTPARFATENDDIFMRSMIQNYALEGKMCHEDADGKPIKSTCIPNGKFFMNARFAKVAAAEVLATHKGLAGAAGKDYLATYFDKAWGHFDVNRTGVIEVIKMPQFMRFLCSDQRMQLGESGF
jgi:hypothetical protein